MLRIMSNANVRPEASGNQSWLMLSKVLSCFMIMIHKIEKTKTSRDNVPSALR